ncbi:MAG TPA: DnaJ domain-containing protein, partial [Acidimicrobiia bacterium]|nr:DnaJ domain-containing protein [Acidimicrobiia bacterium]
MAPQRDWFEKDYYAVLGLKPDASDKDVQKAYRKLAKEN